MIYVNKNVYKTVNNAHKMTLINAEHNTLVINKTFIKTYWLCQNLKLCMLIKNSYKCIKFKQRSMYHL